MKKYFVVALAALFVLGFAASSFAIHAEIPAETQAVVSKGATQITIGGDIRVRGIMDNNTKDFNNDATASGDDAKWDQRVRLQVEAKVTPNTTGLIQLEAGNADNTTGSQDIRDWGTEPNQQATGTIKAGDVKQDGMRILQAWILHQGSGLLGVPALVKIGHMPVQISELYYSHTKFGDDAILLGVDPVKELHLILGHVKLGEGNTWNADDVNGYTLIASYDINKDSNVGASATYADGQNRTAFGYSFFPINNAISNAFITSLNPSLSRSALTLTNGADLHLWNFAITGKTKIANLGVKGEFDIQAGKITDLGTGSDSMKFRGMAGKLDVDYTIQPVTLMFGAAYGSGDDFKKVLYGDDNKIRNFVTTQDAVQHFTFVYEYLTPNAAGNQYGGLQNTWYLKAGAKADIMKNLDGMINVYYLRAVHATPLGAVAEQAFGNSVFSSKAIGTEVDVNLNYQIDKNLKYYVEGGYLFAGNFWKNVTPATVTAAGTTTKSPDDAWAVRHGIQLSF